MNYVYLFIWCIFVFSLTLIIGALVHKTENFLIESFGSTCVDFIPFKMPENYPTTPDTIFVSVASYRDQECSTTLQSLFKQADKPERIFVGICEQNKEQNESCKGPTKFQNNIRVITLDYTDAKGPTYARYHCASLWKGEEYFLQIDSHTTFLPHWDTDLIHMMKQIKNDPNESDYPVLSVYPPTKDQLNTNGVPEMDFGRISENGMVYFLCGWTDTSSQPKRSNKPWAAGGLMFLESKFLKEIPFDPNLSHLFQGEEVLFSARLFTNGYDFYTPNKKIAYHHYNRDGPMYHKDIKNSHDCRAKAAQRVKFLLGLTDKSSIVDEFIRDLHYYGLGKFRSIDDFWNASGIDLENKIVERWNENNAPSSNYNGWWFRKDGYTNIRKRSN